MINIADSSLGKLTSGFGLRAQPTEGASTNHKGIDVVLSDPNVPAVQTGKVIESSYNDSRGNYVTMLHNDGSFTRYQHLENNAVSVGDIVKEGQTIGIMGNTGVSTGTHLHFEAISKTGEFVDPVEYLKEGTTSFIPSIGEIKENFSENVDNVLSVIVKFISYMALAILAAFLFFKAFDIKIKL